MFFVRWFMTPDSDLCRTPIPEKAIKWFGMKSETGFDLLRKGGSAYIGIGVRIGADLATDRVNIKLSKSDPFRFSQSLSLAQASPLQKKLFD